MSIKIYCDKANEYELMREVVSQGILNPSFRGKGTSHKEEFNLDCDKINIEYNVKEFTERSIIEVNDNDLTFLKMCIYFMRDKLKADNKVYEETLFGLSYCTTSKPEKSVYENMIKMNTDTINECTDWLEKLEQV